MLPFRESLPIEFELFLREVVGELLDEVGVDACGEVKGDAWGDGEAVDDVLDEVGAVEYGKGDT